MFSSSESDSSSNSDHFTSTSSDEEVLKDMDEENMAISIAWQFFATPMNFSHPMKLRRGWGNM